MEEPIAEFYYKKLKESNPIPALVGLYSSIFGIKPQSSHYSMFGRLNNLYGGELVFFSILDLVDIDDVDHNNIVRLLSYLCKKKLEKKFKGDSYNSLETYSKEMTKLLTRKRKLKIPDPFGEENVR